MNPDSRKNHGKRRRTWMRFAGISVLITTVGVVASASQAGADPVTPKHFQPAPAGSTVKHLPLGVSNAPVTVVVQMAGDPVTVADADAATPLTGRSVPAVAHSLRQQQTSAEPKIRASAARCSATTNRPTTASRCRSPATRSTRCARSRTSSACTSVQTFKPDNVHGVPLIGAPAVWDGLNGFHGEGVKVAVIDTGIDYTHADFGGPGTARPTPTRTHRDRSRPTRRCSARTLRRSRAASTSSATTTTPTDERRLQPVPHPDPNPLDCAGHGTHVAGTAAGFGVLADGRPTPAPYNADDGQRQQLDRRPGRRAQGRPVRGARLRLRGLDRRDRRRHRVGRRPRHGRHQHVARLAVRHRG